MFNARQHFVGSSQTHLIVRRISDWCENPYLHKIPTHEDFASQVPNEVSYQGEEASLDCRNRARDYLHASRSFPDCLINNTPGEGYKIGSPFFDTTNCDSN